MGQSGAFGTNLDYYKAFYYVAKYHSISLAANSLELTQPSVSNTIRRLEEDLGCKLFVRTRNGMKLTGEGETLWTKIEPACELLLAGEEEVQALKSCDGGVLHIAAYEQGFLIYVMPALNAFRRDYPNVKVNLISRPIQTMPDMVKSGLADLAIIFSPVTEDVSLKYYLIHSFSEPFVAGMKFAHLKDRELTFRDLCALPKISYYAGTAKDYLRNAFEAKGLVYETALEVSSVSLMLRAIVDNYGIGNVLPQLVQRDLEDGNLFLLNMKEQLPARQAMAITRSTPSRVTEVFIKEYLTKFSRLSGQDN